MSVNLNNVKEIIVPMSSAGFSVDGGKSKRTYLVPISSYNTPDGDLQTIIQQILGYVDTTASTDGTVKRNLPLADPVWPWMFASGITDIRGTNEKEMTQEAAGDLGYDVAPFPNFAFFPYYVVGVEFTPRPYVVETVDQITKGELTWYDSTGATQVNKYATEWQRYTDFIYESKEDSVTTQLGSMVFSATGAANNQVYPAMPRKFLNNSVITFRWYQVPFRLISSPKSWINSSQSKGCVNQFDWYNPGTGNMFPAGSLLYVNFTPRRYQQSVPTKNGAGVFDTSDKLCDIDFHFQYTNRTTPDAPAAPSNANYIVGGWNLLPWQGDRQFHYAVTKASTAPGPVLPGGIPSFNSFPFELLFSDCDS